MDITSKPWKEKKLPERILVIRLQALGDTIITLPYLQALRNTLPAGTRLDFLTRKDNATIPQCLNLFNNVYCIKGGRKARKRVLFAGLLLPRLLFNHYQIVIDLQNNGISRLARHFLKPRAWSEFDRFSPVAAGERTRLTIESIGLGTNYIDSKFEFEQLPETDQILKDYGWDGKSKLVILNPAGAFITRNWSPDNYVDFANLWAGHFPDTQFVVTGIVTIADKALYFKQQLGDKLICLVESTSQVEAFAIIQRAQFILSEDSGLMHMAWVSNIPTIAMFGSTRSDWARPLNKNSLLLSSDDLSCGNCMLATCIHGDVRCLTRYTPQFVFEKITAFMQTINAEL
jgi:ADP-heptose:LPS heptosyltransferase